MSKVVSATSFDFIRYSNCWEDADILVEGLRIGEGDKCLSICSAGDNSLALLVSNPDSVTAIDLSDAQIACLELRMSAFGNLNYEDMLKFLGVIDSDNRLEIYNCLKKDISKQARGFWEERPKLIETGIIHAGKLEGFFAMLRNSLKFVHFFNEDKLKKLLEEKDPEQQKRFYYKEWNNLRWRLLIKFLYSNTIFGRFGRDPNFYKYVEQNMSDFMLERNEYAFTSIPIYKNPYFNYVFTGNFPMHALPLYLRKENYGLIKNRLSKVKIVKANLLDYLKQNRGIRYDAFNLSNIFEYMNAKEYKNAFSRILASSEKGARIAYYNAFVDRLAPSGVNFKVDKELSEGLYGKAGAFFYKRFIVGDVT
ncbi:MAG: BtaA family protein [Clostridia bacterium]|nr:BtaA family protein [Clostridia bacterium]